MGVDGDEATSKTGSWSEVVQKLPTSCGPVDAQVLRSLRDSLERADDTLVESAQGDKSRAREAICEFASRCIAPVVPEGDTDEDVDEEEARQALIKSCRSASEDSLAILARATDSWHVQVQQDALITLVAFTDAGQPWASDATAGQASSILGLQLADRNMNDFIVDGILQSYLRPLFQKSRPATVTASGRKAEFPENIDSHQGLTNETRKTKPWKYGDLRSISVFAWAVTNASNELITKNWPLFIPVLLTLLDDPSTPVRVQGLQTLHGFLTKLPARVLQETGLHSVFEQAVLPTLMFLPSITPEEESLQLLPPAYAALLDLAEHSKDQSSKDKLFDKILREGIFAAYYYAKEHVKIVQTLLVETESVVTAMGLQAVKHLKDLIPMLSEIMTDPFASTLPSRLIAANKALQAVIRTCWPRLTQGAWQNEVLKILLVCWIDVLDSDIMEQQRKYVQDELVHSANLLISTMNAGGTEAEPNIRPLIAKEPRLGGLFAGL